MWFEDWTVPRPDGGVLQGLSVGDPSGVPVCLLPGTPASRQVATFAADEAAACGVLLVGLNRPGYGSSTVTAPSLRVVGQLVHDVMSILGHDTYAVLGISGGGPFAIAAAVVAPQRVSRMGIAVGIGPWRDIDPVDDPAGLEDREILTRLDAGDIEGALDGFRAMAARDYGELLAQPDEVVLDQFATNMAARDRRWFDPIRDKWICDWREALSSYDGFALDNVAWGGPWDVVADEVDVPTRLWAGDDDSFVPHRHAEWLHTHLRCSDLVVRSDSGHGSAVFPHWTEMLTWLRDGPVSPSGGAG